MTTRLVHHNNEFSGDRHIHQKIIHKYTRNLHNVIPSTKRDGRKERERDRERKRERETDKDRERERVDNAAVAAMTSRRKLY